MKKRTIAPEQLDGLVFLSLLTLGTETLPSLLAVAGSAAWLCPLAAGGVVWLAGRMVRQGGSPVHFQGDSELSPPSAFRQTT